MSQGQRKLAAIMFTDMVGYTALTQSNESQAMEVIERHNRLLRPFFQKFHGTEIKAIGDSFLVEFESALDALKCAVEIQSYLHEYNFSSNSWRINLRIGIHLGDVIHQDGDVFGDAVNVASRIEPIAEPEGVCISEQVYDQVRNKVPYRLHKLEPKHLKNVAIPIDVYRIEMPWENEAVGPSAQLDTRRIAILPFANMSPDSNDSYFADGITEEIISIASNVSGLSVISRTSVMGYKGTTKKVKEIGRELEVGSVLEGSFRKAGNKIRITTQLINVNDDTHVWAQSYDRELDDVFKIQTDIAEQVANSLKVRIMPGEKQRIEKAPTRSTEAFSLYLKGRYYWNERTENGLKTAIKYFEKALEKDASYALAYVGIADCYWVLVDHGYMSSAEGSPKVKEYLTKALHLDDALGEAHATLGGYLGNAEWDWNQAEKEFRRAIALSPSYASAHHWYAVHLAHTGKVEEAIREIARAHELDPNSLQILTAKGIMFYYAREYDKAIRTYKEALEIEPNFLPALNNLWYAYLRLSKLEEAKALNTRTLEAVGGVMKPSWLGGWAYSYAAVGEHETARRLLEQAERLGAQYTSAWNIGMAHYYLGETDLAFEWFNKALEQKDPGLASIKVDPEYDALRNDERFVQLIKHVGLYQVS